MTKIKVMSIQELLCIKHLRSSYKTAIVFITHKSCYYDFGTTWFTHLDIKDEDKPHVEDYQVKRLDSLIQLGVRFDTIYVCCDAGLRRSPAVALYIAFHLHDSELMREIEESHKFMWFELYEELQLVHNKFDDYK